MQRHDVIIVGGGPAGLGAARRLAQLGVRDIVVLEREREAGGIPRHCGHFGFGWQSHRNLWSGPGFAAKLRRDASGIVVRSSTTVLELLEGGRLRVHTPLGLGEIQAGRVLITTGARETPRAPRFVGGTRPQGVMNTGALQQHVYLHGSKPFARPVIVGTEWVSFSALITCSHARIRPVAMLEASGNLDAPSIFAAGASLAYRVPVRLNHELITIHGSKTVEAVEVAHRGSRETITCDGVIFTGQFQPESALYAGGRLEHSCGAPTITKDFRTSDPYIFAAGNVLLPLKTAGQCVVQARAAAEAIFRSLR